MLTAVRSGLSGKRAVISGVAGAGTGVALCLLSLHEIESTVQVQPPGLDNLAQYLLDQLHYLRQDQLAAAGATMTGIGLVGAVVAGVVMARGRSLRL